MTIARMSAVGVRADIAWVNGHSDGRIDKGPREFVVMKGAKLQKLAIDMAFFGDAFDRDVDFHEAYPQSANLDRHTGEIVWFYVEDFDAEMEAGIPPEENQATRQRIEAMPDRYLEIPGLDHGDHHDLLKNFLDSDWTDNDEVRRFAQDAYHGSIGRWKKSIDDDSIIHAFYDFRDRKTTKMAEAFLRSHGIEPVWK